MTMTVYKRVEEVLYVVVGQSAKAPFCLERIDFWILDF